MATTTTETASGGCRAWRASPHGMGAVALVEVAGASADATSALLGAVARRDVAPGRIALRDLVADDGAAIDRGLIARLSPTRAMLMPHGGTRIVELLAERLVALGADWIDAPLAHDRDRGPACDAGIDPEVLYPEVLYPEVLYPEAADRVEALALAACARAASPRAVPLLLAEPARWRGFDPRQLDAADLARAARLGRLVDPPRVALVGRPNAGKSTLSNVLLGHEGSIASAEAGTTRDAVAARVDLDGLVVEWLDLPGFRATSDPIERAAIALAEEFLAEADLVVELAAPGIGWPHSPRAADLRVYAKVDEPAAADDATRASAALSVSARTGEGIDALRRALRERLVSDADLADPRPWCFDPRLLGSA